MGLCWAFGFLIKNNIITIVCMWEVFFFLQFIHFLKLIYNFMDGQKSNMSYEFKLEPITIFVNMLLNFFFLFCETTLLIPSLTFFWR